MFSRKHYDNPKWFPIYGIWIEYFPGYIHTHYIVLHSWKTKTSDYYYYYYSEKTVLIWQYNTTYKNTIWFHTFISCSYAITFATLSHINKKYMVKSVLWVVDLWPGGIFSEAVDLPRRVNKVQQYKTACSQTSLSPVVWSMWP